MKKCNPLELVREQYRQLNEKLRSTRDFREKAVLFKRLVNLVGVMQFLLYVNNNS